MLAPGTVATRDFEKTRERGARGRRGGVRATKMLLLRVGSLCSIAPGVSCPPSPSAPGRKRVLFSRLFLYVCPEPVLAKTVFSGVVKWHRKKGGYRTFSDSRTRSSTAKSTTAAWSSETSDSIRWHLTASIRIVRSRSSSSDAEESAQESAEESAEESAQESADGPHGAGWPATETDRDRGADRTPHAYKQKHSAAHTCTELCNFLSCS